MFENLQEIRERFEELNELLMKPEVLSDRNLNKKYSKERASIEAVVTAYGEYEKVEADIAEANEIIESSDDAEEKEFARAELEELKAREAELEELIKKLLIPRDPNDEKNTIVEIRAGTGGEEAALFASDLYRMYTRYAEGRKWKVEVMNSNPSVSGGFKEIIFAVEGDGAFSRFKFESGVHRVQRVPVTESQGRIHTSAATVAVLPEAEEVDVEINPDDVHVDVFRSSGPGGQSVNTTDSAVRITHLPTGLVVTCQDEKSQIKNKAKALKVLRARLLDQVVREQDAQRSAERKNQIGDGDRSGRIRTYNFPQGRVTDHRIGLTLYKLEEIMQGEVDPVIDELISHYQAQALQDEAS